MVWIANGLIFNNLPMSKLILFYALIWGYMCTFLVGWNFPDFILSGMLSLAVIAGIAPYLYIRYYDGCVLDGERGGWVLPLIIFLYYILTMSILILKENIEPNSWILLSICAMYFVKYVDDMAAGLVLALPPQDDVRLFFREYKKKKKSDYLSLWWLLIVSCLLPWGARVFWNRFSPY